MALTGQDLIQKYFSKLTAELAEIAELQSDSAGSAGSAVNSETHF